MRVITKPLVPNDKTISKFRKNQDKKLHNLFLKNSFHNSVTSRNPNKVTFDSLSQILNSAENSLLTK